MVGFVLYSDGRLAQLWAMAELIDVGALGCGNERRSDKGLSR
jgi:hypothetical protein